MSDASAQPLDQTCPRCKTHARQAVWCSRCALNLRRPTPTEPEVQLPLQPGVPPPMPGLLWDRVPGRPNPAVKAGGVTLAAAAVLIGAFAATASGGSSPTPPLFVPPVSVPESTEPIPTTPESTPTTPESTESTESTPTTTGATVETSAVQQVLNEYESDYANENVEGLKTVFSSNLVRQDGSHAPEGLAQALEAYQHQFDEVKNPSYSLSEMNIQPGDGEATASGQFTITDQNGTVTGSISFHMVEENERLLIDKLTIANSK